MGDDSEKGTLSRRRVLQIAGTTGVVGASGLSGVASAEVEGGGGFNGDPYSDPEYPSDEWFAREQSNWQKTREEPIRQANDPGFEKRWQEQSTTNYVTHRRNTTLEETEWDRDGLCETWGEQCTGDPYMYPAEEPVWSGDPFYEETGDVERVVFYDRADEPARINGRVWKPKDAEPGDDLPGVVIVNGGVATETMYWWLAQSLVESGYVVLTFDPVGQGRSEDSDLDRTAHQVDANDFFRSTPDEPYPHNEAAEERGDEDAVPIKDYNPFHEYLDRDRIGNAGHSAGALSTAETQAYADGEWPGIVDENPVDVAVVWDSASFEGDEVEPRVPMMEQNADYRSDASSWVPQPKTEPPDPEARKVAYDNWRSSGYPIFQFTIRGTTHFEWSRVPTFPASSWDSWGNEMGDYFTVAWFDYWLKEPGEPGHDDAEYRLLSIHDDPWDDRLSFYYESAYYFPSNPDANWPAPRPDSPPGNWYFCEDIVDGDC